MRSTVAQHPGTDGDGDTGVTAEADRGQAEDVLPELAASDWMHHAETVADTRFWVVARRLPQIVRAALEVAWQASRRDTVAAITLNVLAGVLTTFGLLATSNVLRELFSAGPTPDRVRAAVPALVVAALAAAGHGGLSIAAGWAQSRLRPQINYQVELRLFEATTSVELAAFDDSGFAEEMDRARDRGMSEAASIVDSTVDLVTGLAGVLATAAAVAIIQPILLPCVVLAAIPSAVTAVRIARREYMHMLARINRRRRMWMLAHLMANRRTAAEVRAYQMRSFLLDEYRRIMNMETVAQLRLAQTQATTRLVGTGAAGAASFAVYAALAMLLLGGRVPIAAAATALLALQAARNGLNTAIHATNQLYEDALYYGDYRSFLDRADTRMPPTGASTVDGFEELVLQDVSLRYPDAPELAVDRVDLVVRRGEVIALVGENGSGKSSLAKLIAGLYRPTSGVLRWNGVDTAALDTQLLAGQVAVMSQDWWRFPFTARQNITVGRPAPAHRWSAVRAAAGAAAAHEMITALPQGYDTLLSREFKDGQDLSGGQWQRLVAARGFYRDAALLICDEPSASLDPRAEHALFAQLRRRPDRAVILITHRLANVRHADRIYVLHEGRLVEEGTHDELVAAGGRYAELFKLQASGYTA